MDVNKMIAQILKQLCCIWEIINSTAGAVIFGSSFSGAGTTEDPKQINVFATGTGYGGGTGTEADPLIIEGGGTPPPTPTIEQVVTAGSIVQKGQMIQFNGGGTPTPSVQGSIQGGPGNTQDYLLINFQAQLRLVGPRVGTGSLVTFEGTSTTVVFKTPTGSNPGRMAWKDASNNDMARVGIDPAGGQDMEIFADPARNLILNGRIGPLPTGLTGPVLATDTWIQAIAKLNTLFP